jgi:hypothetical protein
MSISINNNQAVSVTYGNTANSVTISANSSAALTVTNFIPVLTDQNLISDIRTNSATISDSSLTYSFQNAEFLIAYLLKGLNPTRALACYSAPVNINQSAATAANATVWAMRSPTSATRNVYIERIYLMLAFDNGTPLGRSLQRYDLQRFSAATPTGGTAITAIKQDNESPPTVVTDIRSIDTGLTTTGLSFETSFLTLSVPATDQTTTVYVREKVGFKLRPGEGLAIRLDVTAVAGQSVCGEIVWSEV